MLQRQTGLHTPLGRQSRVERERSRDPTVRGSLTRDGARARRMHETQMYCVTTD